MLRRSTADAVTAGAGAAAGADVVRVNARGVLGIPAVVLLVVLALAGGYKAWWLLLGDEVARNAFDREGAAAAIRWSPDDPLAHHTQAVIDERLAESFDARENARAALGGYEAAARLSPNDFRYWVDLGRAQERAGDVEAGIESLRRATELAPYYVLPRWHLGNALMRAGRDEEAFAELRRAGEMDEDYRHQVVNLAWRYYGGDVKRAMHALGDTPGVQLDLISYLAAQRRYDEALEVFAAMHEGQGGEGDDPAAAIKAAARGGLARALFDAKRFRDAARLARAEPSLVANGSFEAEVPPPNRDLFGWQLAPVAGAQVQLDTGVRERGARSLRFSFAAPSGVDLRGLRQTVAVDPAARYRLTYFTRAEGVSSAGLPVVEVVDARTESGLASSSPAGGDVWERRTIEFAVPAGTDGITIRFTRQGCPDPVCPIFGRVWYDEMTLEKIGGRRGD